MQLRHYHDTFVDVLGDGAEMLRALARHDGEQQLYFSELVRSHLADIDGEESNGNAAPSRRRSKKARPALPSKEGLPDDVIHAATIQRSTPPHSSEMSSARSWKAASATLRSSGRLSSGGTSSGGSRRELSRSSSAGLRVGNTRSALANSTPAGAPNADEAEAREAAKNLSGDGRELSLSANVLSRPAAPAELEPSGSAPALSSSHSSALGDSDAASMRRVPSITRTPSPAITAGGATAQPSPRHSEFAALDLETVRSDIRLRRKTMSPLMALDLSGAENNKRLTMVFDTPPQIAWDAASHANRFAHATRVPSASDFHIDASTDASPSASSSSSFEVLDLDTASAALLPSLPETPDAADKISGADDDDDDDDDDELAALLAEGEAEISTRLETAAEHRQALLGDLPDTPVSEDGAGMD